MLKEGDLTNLALAAQKAIPDSISIKCLKEFTDDQEIAIYTLKEGVKKLAGKLYVWANTNQKKVNIVAINLNTKPSIEEEEENIKSKTTQNWRRNPLDVKINNVVTEYLRQAYIEFVSEEVITLDVSNDEQIKKFNRTADGLIAYYFWRQETKYNEEEDCDWTYYEDAPEGFIDLSAYLRKLLRLQYGDKYKNYIKIFYTDGNIYAVAKYREDREGVQGIRKEDHKDLHRIACAYNNCVLLPKVVGQDTVTHEILHLLNIMHTFSNKEYQKTAKFTFESKTTDNLMDYSQLATPRIPMFTLFKWQWFIANKAITARGEVKTETDMLNEHLIKPF